MKRPFVIRLSPDSNPAKGKFQGRVEKVDIGQWRRDPIPLDWRIHSLPAGLPCEGSGRS